MQVELEESHKNLQMVHSQHAAAVNEWSEKYQGACVNLDLVRKEKEALESCLMEKESTVSAVRAKGDTLEEQVNTLKTQVAQLEGTIEQLHKERRTLEEQVLQLQGEQVALSTNYAKAQTELSTCSRELQNTQDSLATAQARVEELTATMDGLTAKLSAIEKSREEVVRGEVGIEWQNIDSNVLAYLEQIIMDLAEQKRKNGDLQAELKTFKLIEAGLPAGIPTIISN